jgi:hypothetical protein
MLLSVFATIAILGTMVGLGVFITALNLGLLPRPEVNEWPYRLLIGRGTSSPADSAYAIRAENSQTGVTVNIGGSPAFALNMLVVASEELVTLVAHQITGDEILSGSDANQWISEFNQVKA